MLRFSANLGFLWPERPLLDRIDAAATAGFRAIEMHWPYDVRPELVADACAHHGISMLALNTATGGAGQFGLGAGPGRQAEFQATVEDALDYCRRAGGTAIHAMAGVIDEGDRAAAQRVLVDNLRIAADKAGELTVLVEPLNHRDRPRYFYQTVEQAIDVIDRVDAPNLKLMFDCYHVGVVGDDVLARLESAYPHVGHVQIAAVPSRREPDEGELDYRDVFRALERLAYSGWVGCEYIPRGDTAAGLAWISALGIPWPPEGVDV